MAGLALFGYGIVLTLRARLGLSPWDVLHQGIARHTPLNFGEANIAVGIVLLAVAWALGVRPGLGTVLNTLLVGTFIDIFVHFNAAPTPSGLIARSLLDVAGIVLVGITTAIYIGANLGAGPRDSLMLALSRRVRVGVARTSIELSALAAGFALGGSAGLGTALFAFGIGPCVEASMWTIEHLGLARPSAGALVPVQAAQGPGPA